MEITEDYLTVLTPKGEFLQVQKIKDHYQIGEEITNHITISRAHTNKKKSWKMPALLSSLVAALLLMATFLPNIFNEPKVSAYVSMDLKTNIELGLNKNLKVIEIRGINKEGKDVASKLKEWKNRDIQSVAEDIVALSKREGYLKNNQQVSFSTVLIDKKDKHIEKAIDSKLETVESPKRNEMIDTKETTMSNKEKEKNNTTAETTQHQSQKPVVKTSKKTEVPAVQQNQPKPVTAAKKDRQPINKPIHQKRINKPSPSSTHHEHKDMKRPSITRHQHQKYPNAHKNQNQGGQYNNPKHTQSNSNYQKHTQNNNNHHINNNNNNNGQKNRNRSQKNHLNGKRDIHPNHNNQQHQQNKGKEKQDKH